MAIPTTRFGQPASQCKKYRNRYGNTTTHCCTATAGYTCSTMRRVLHAAHTPRLLHDHATRNFCAHSYMPRRTYYYIGGVVSPTQSLIELQFRDRLTAFYFSDLV